MARADISPESLGRLSRGDCGVFFFSILSVVMDLLVRVGVLAGSSKGEVKGRELRVKTSPERRIGTLSPKVVVRISSASTLMGVLEGVWRVRG